MPYARCVIAAVLALSIGASSASADVGVRGAPSAARAHARAIGIAAPQAAARGDVLIAIVSAQTVDRATLRAPSGWRLAGRATSGRGSKALSQAVFFHVVRAGDPRRLVFRSQQRTALRVHILAARGADPIDPIGELVASPAAHRGVLDAPELAKAAAGDLLVVEYASMGGSAAGSSTAAVTRTNEIVVQIITQPVKRKSKTHLARSTPSLAFVVKRRYHRWSTSPTPSTPTDPPSVPAPPTSPPKPPASPPKPSAPPAPPAAPPAPPAPSGLLMSDSFNVADGLITNEYAYFDPSDSASRVSSTWQLDSGSLFARNGAAWTGVPDATEPNAGSTNGNDSAIFRLVTKRADFGNVSVSFQLNNSGLTSTSATPAEDWDGVHIFLRYQSQTSLYYASINRRDGTAIIKKKVTGGPDNGGTYYELTPYVSHPVPYGAWQSITATVQNNAGGTVTIRLLSGGVLVAQATDTGVGGPPITAPGRVGLRGDNANFQFDDFRVSSLS